MAFQFFVNLDLFSNDCFAEMAHRALNPLKLYHLLTIRLTLLVRGNILLRIGTTHLHVRS